MHTDLVVTVSGPDRLGIVDSLAAVIVDQGGNWEESRLARLSGWFCGMLLVRVSEDRADALEAALQAVAGGVSITVSRGAVESRTLCEVTLCVTCADRHGIVHDLSQTLGAAGANIEELTSTVSRAPMSGEPLFTATLRVSAPVSVGTDAIVTALEGLQSDLLVEVA